MDIDRNTLLPYRVAFNHVHGIGPVREELLSNYFGSLEEAWNAPADALRGAGLPWRAIDSLVAFRGTHDPHELTQSILDRHIQITIPEADDYPVLLKEIQNPPPLLYYAGKLPASNEKLLSIVGTRRVTQWGRNTTREMAGFLTVHGVGVVSGLARGVDGIAHQTVLDYSGKTYGVLGCGIDHIYPPEHRDLARKMAHSGAVISEYPPGTPPDKSNFPQRNRIISGMSSGCLVIEAGERSGSLITARFAAEQGREVFVIPGNYGSVQSKGANSLIRSGAQIIVDKEELLDFLQTWQAVMPEKQPLPMQMSFASPEDQKILQAIESEPLHVNEISRVTGIPIPRIASQVILLELQGFIQETAPQTYQKMNFQY